MGNKLIITQNGAQLCSALFVEEELTELHLTEVDLKRNKAAVGDIYVGRVKKIQRNLDAAFIEIAPHTECYYSMKQYKTPFFTKKNREETVV